MTAYTFHKMHGCGNDFVLFDWREQQHSMDAAFARHIAHRRYGVGCDQILILSTAQHPDHLAEYAIWNADGSRAEQCGNGARCVARFLDCQQGTTGHARILIHGATGVMELRRSTTGEYRIDMGKPLFSAADIPTTLVLHNNQAELQIDDRKISIWVASMGNPHAIWQVADVAQAAVGTLGPAISKHPAFPQQCNASFVELVSASQLKLRVYERGAGETLACGSAACAVAAVMRRHGLVEQRVRIALPGGELEIDWDGADDSSIWMTGPAEYVYTGTINRPD